MTKTCQVHSVTFTEYGQNVNKHILKKWRLIWGKSFAVYINSVVYVDCGQRHVVPLVWSSGMADSHGIYERRIAMRCQMEVSHATNDLCVNARCLTLRCVSVSICLALWVSPVSLSLCLLSLSKTLMSAGIATVSIAVSMFPVPSPASVNPASSWQEITAPASVSYAILLLNSITQSTPCAFLYFHVQENGSCFVLFLLKMYAVHINAA